MKAHLQRVEVNTYLPISVCGVWYPRYNYRDVPLVDCKKCLNILKLRGMIRKTIATI